eukprot:355375-Chlamydomonas_euryale.AAC.1
MSGLGNQQRQVGGVTNKGGKLDSGVVGLGWLGHVANIHILAIRSSTDRSVCRRDAELATFASRAVCRAALGHETLQNVTRGALCVWLAKRGEG